MENNFIENHDEDDFDEDLDGYNLNNKKTASSMVSKLQDAFKLKI